MATTEKSVPDDLDHVVEAIEQFAEKHGYTPYLSQLENLGVISRSTFQYRYEGGYNKFLNQIDHRPAHAEIDHSDMVNEAKITAALKEETPEWKEFINESQYPAFAWQKHFRSYADLLFQIDEEPPTDRCDNEKYGPGWNKVTREWIRYRDERRCQNCGMREKEHRAAYSTGLNIHHEIPPERWANANSPNKPSNLITLCVSCHGNTDT